MTTNNPISVLREALDELCDILQGVLDDECKTLQGRIDSFTLQPARAALAATESAAIQPAGEGTGFDMKSGGNTAAARKAAERVDAMHKGVVGVFAAIKAEQSSSPADQAFYSFWYSHMVNEQMTGALAEVGHATARYVWDAALAAPATQPTADVSAPSDYRAKYAAENPPFNGKLDTWQAVAGKYRRENEELRAELAARAAARVTGAGDEITWDQSVLLAGIQALCIAADQELSRRDGSLSEFDKGWFLGQLHIFDMYTPVEKGALNEAREYLRAITSAQAPQQTMRSLYEIQRDAAESAIGDDLARLMLVDPAGKAK